jgi:hypothetical protein
MLELERSCGAKVFIEVDRMVNHHGQPMHQMQFRSTEQIQREIIEDPTTGIRTHTSEYISEEVANFLFWQNERECIKVGYRFNLNGPKDQLAIFETILQSFQLLET